MLNSEQEGAIEKHIAGKWHIITLQESIENLEHEFLQNRFHVTHFGGCAVLLNKDTFHPDIKVSSIYLHDTRDGQQHDVKEGESGWVLQGVMSRASFRRLSRSAKSFNVDSHQWYRQKVAPYDSCFDVERTRGFGSRGLQRICLAPLT